MLPKISTNLKVPQYFVIVLAFIAPKSSEGVADIDFCKNKFKCQVKHTICTLKHNCGKGPNCQQYSNLPLSDDEKRKILQKHNELRSEVALGVSLVGVDQISLPRAANMKELVWDFELEFMAQCWANQCPNNHDQCRKQSDGVEAGQNLAYSTHNSLMTMLQGWFDEYKHTTADLMNKFVSTTSLTGHFTQMVYSNSSRLGCARSKFGCEMFGGDITYLLVCNYATQGNILEHPVYQKGKPCSNCPKGSQCHKKYKGLCTTKLSTSKVPSICKFASDKKNCHPIVKSHNKIVSGGGSVKKKQQSKGGSTNKPEKTSVGHREFNHQVSNGPCIIERKIIVISKASGFRRHFFEKLLTLTYTVYRSISYLLNRLLYQS